MTNLQKQLQNETRELRMTSAEKSAMRARLQAAMITRATAPTQSPYQWLFAPRAFAVLSIAALLVISTGTAYASTSALPGGTLYPIKTKVIEPLAVALATTPTAKAEANASIAATRVKEAEILAARGSLTPEVAQVISDNYSVHASRALALAADVDANISSEPANAEPAQNSPSDLSEPAQDLSIGSDKPREGLAAASTTVAVAPQAKIMSFSVGISVTETATTTATTSASAQRTASTSLRNAKSVPTTARSTSSGQATSTLTHRLNERLSAQAKILGDLNIEVRIKADTKDPRGDKDWSRNKSRDDR